MRSSPPGQRLDRVRLVAMDMDSTLITIECVDEIADMMGIKPQVAAITASAMRGEIDFRESLTRRVALLAGLDVAALQRVYDERLELSPRRGAPAGRHARRRRPVAAGLGRVHFFHRSAESAPRDSTILREHAGDRTTASSPAAWSGRSSTPKRRPRASSAARDARRGRRPGGRDRRRGERSADAGIRRRQHRLPRQAEVVRARATYAIDCCGLDAVLNLFV